MSSPGRPGQERRQASEARRGNARLPRHAGGGAADGQPTGAECDNAQHVAPQTQVDVSTIARALSGMLITIKKCNDVPANRNRPDIINDRKR